MGYAKEALIRRDALGYGDVPDKDENSGLFSAVLTLPVSTFFQKFVYGLLAMNTTIAI